MAAPSNPRASAQAASLLRLLVLLAACTVALAAANPFEQQQHKLPAKGKDTIPSGPFVVDLTPSDFGSVPPLSPQHAKMQTSEAQTSQAQGGQPETPQKQQAPLGPHPGDGRLWFVEYFVPYCRGCKRMAQHWSELGEALHGCCPDSRIARFDCLQDEDLCEALGVVHTPTLNLYVNGSFTLSYRADIIHIELLLPFVMRMRREHLPNAEAPADRDRDHAATPAADAATTASESASGAASAAGSSTGAESMDAAAAAAAARAAGGGGAGVIGPRMGDEQQEGPQEADAVQTKQPAAAARYEEL